MRSSQHPSLHHAGRTEMYYLDRVMKTEYPWRSTLSLPARRGQSMLRLRIKEIAERQRLNRNQLQLKSGVTLPLLTCYWKNQTESVTLPALERIARTLGVK